MEEEEKDQGIPGFRKGHILWGPFFTELTRICWPRGRSHVVQLSIHSFVIHSFTHSVFAEHPVPPRGDGGVKPEAVPPWRSSQSVCSDHVALCLPCRWSPWRCASNRMGLQVPRRGRGSLQEDPLIWGSKKE